MKLQVEGRISMHDVSLYLFVGDLFEAEEETKFPLAKSEHFSGTFSIIQDTKYSDRHLMTTHEYDLLLTSLNTILIFLFFFFFLFFF